MTEIVLEAGGYGAARFRGLVAPAVLVVDMTNDFGHPDGVYPRNGAVCAAFADAVEPVAQVMRAAEGAGVPTILATQIIYADRGGRAVAGGGLVHSRPWLRDEGFRPGTWGVEIVDALPRTDYVIEKTRASAFFATPLEVLLRGLGAQTLVVAGCFTNQCVEATVRDAHARDLDVVLVSDGVAAFDAALHEASMQSLRPLSTQLPSAEVVRMLGTRPGGAPG